MRSRAGDRLRFARFAPSAAARGTVLLSPGRTEPLEKYGEVAGELLARGFVVLVHDWVGQGLSDRLHRDPLRGHIRGGAGRFIDGWRDGLKAFGERLPRPWIALAHSMGGGLTALALTEGALALDAAVLSAPMMGVETGSRTPREVAVAATAMRWLGRGATLPLPASDPLRDTFENNVLTHDPVRFARGQALIVAHPELRLAGPTWSWLAFALDLSARLSRPGVAERIAVPVVVVAAGEEQLVDVPASRLFAERLPQGRFELIEGARHEIMMETDDLRARFWTVFDPVADQVAPRRAQSRSGAPSGK